MSHSVPLYQLHAPVLPVWIINTAQGGSYSNSNLEYLCASVWGVRIGIDLR